ncbi:hypothetical protein DIE14_18465 [Burkholderia sp. Bp9017]|uniref:hypothetical protein n=1 Tax=unclassified Burkholderia TaxID=2613784 RepID=UPI000F6037E1|nr:MULTISPECIES: hypothetical protein [unclassified Burkholderia]RQZ25128.1 hypothetical protein DIE14_18465 [Burkholderia sp. Bp9017]RQZ33121.1 hypothetical protein DIE13_18375 [Burkholderia sp. Bp9016]
MEKQKHPAISVAAKADTFRRAGHVFGRTPQTIALAAFHPDAYRAITEDKSLVVVHTAIELDEAEAERLPHHHADHVKKHLAHVDTLTLQVSEDDAKRALALADIETDLTAREAALAKARAELDAAEADLKARVVEFDERYAGLVTRENDLNELARQLDERQGAIDAAEKSTAGAKSSSQGRKS